MASFAPNCSIPSSGTHYVPSPNVRGTMQIVWSCLSIIVICTWTIQHLNVPVQARPRSNFQSFLRTLYLFRRKVKWMIVTLLGPEFMVGKSLADRSSAFYNKRVMTDFAAIDVVEWTDTHAFFANMGGFAISFAAASDELSDTDSPDEDKTTSLGSCQQGSSGFSFRLSCSDINGNDAQSFEHLKREDSVVRKSNEHEDSRGPVLSTETLPIGVDEPAGDAETDMRSIEAVISLESLREVGTHAYISRFADGPQLDVIRNRNKKLDKTIGEIDWSVSPKNRLSVIEAIGQARYNDYTWRFREFVHNAAALQGNFWIVDAAQLACVREANIITKLPSLLEEEIHDRSKGDALLKALAIVQVFWLVLSLVVRQVKGLPISQLEIATLAFTVPSLLSYCLTWSKPKDVQTPNYITAVRYPTIPEMVQIASLGPRRTFTGPQRRSHWIPNNMVHSCGQNRHARSIVGYGSVGGAVIFGALHCLAWNATFPSTAERWVWRAVAVFSIGLPLLWGTTQILGRVYKRDHRRLTAAGKPRVHRTLYSYISHTGLLLYIAGRLFVIVEAIRCLFYLPPEAFVTTWATNLPQIS